MGPTYELFELRGRLQLIKEENGTKLCLNTEGEFQELGVFLEIEEFLTVMLEKVSIYAMPKIQIHVVNLIDMLQHLIQNKNAQQEELEHYNEYDSDFTCDGDTYES